MEPTGIEPVTSCLQNGTAGPLDGTVLAGFAAIRDLKRMHGSGRIRRDPSGFGQRGSRCCPVRAARGLTVGPRPAVRTDRTCWAVARRCRQRERYPSTAPPRRLRHCPAAHATKCDARGRNWPRASLGCCERSLGFDFNRFGEDQGGLELDCGACFDRAGERVFERVDIALQRQRRPPFEGRGPLYPARLLELDVQSFGRDVYGADFADQVTLGNDIIGFGAADALEDGEQFFPNGPGKGHANLGLLLLAYVAELALHLKSDHSGVLAGKGAHRASRPNAVAEEDIEPDFGAAQAAHARRFGPLTFDGLSGAFEGGFPAFRDEPLRAAEFRRCRRRRSCHSG